MIICGDPGSRDASAAWDRFLPGPLRRTWLAIFKRALGTANGDAVQSIDNQSQSMKIRQRAAPLKRESAHFAQGICPWFALRSATPRQSRARFKFGCKGARAARFRRSGTIRAHLGSALPTRSARPAARDCAGRSGRRPTIRSSRGLPRLSRSFLGFGVGGRHTNGS